MEQSSTSFQMNGLTVRRDAGGVIHISGAPIECIGSSFDDEVEGGGLVFCLHDPHDDRCPGDVTEGVFTYGNWFRGWAPMRRQGIFPQKSDGEELDSAEWVV
jgi:hypothetical protein